MTQGIHMRYRETVVTNLVVIGCVGIADSVCRPMEDAGSRNLIVSDLRHRVRQRDDLTSLDQLGSAKNFRRSNQVGGAALVVRPPSAPVLQFRAPAKIVGRCSRRCALGLTLRERGN